MKSGDRRAQILSCARLVFAERGFHATSIADICAKAGIGRGTLYQHFDNKRDVFFAVVDEIADRVAHVISKRAPAAQMEGASAAPPKLIAAFCAKRLRELLDAVFADEASIRLVLREAYGLDGGIDHVIRRLDGAVLAAFADDLQSATKMGVFDCPDPHLTAMFIMGGVEKLILAAIEADEPIDFDGIVRVTIRIQLFGLLSDQVLRQTHPSNDTLNEAKK